MLSLLISCRREAVDIALCETPAPMVNGMRVCIQDRGCGVCGFPLPLLPLPERLGWMHHRAQQWPHHFSSFAQPILLAWPFSHWTSFKTSRTLSSRLAPHTSSPPPPPPPLSLLFLYNDSHPSLATARVCLDETCPSLSSPPLYYAIVNAPWPRLAPVIGAALSQPRAPSLKPNVIILCSLSVCFSVLPAHSGRPVYSAVDRRPFPYTQAEHMFLPATGVVGGCFSSCGC